MNGWELVYNLAEFFWSSFWYYTGLILFILVVRGDVTRAIHSIRNYFARVKQAYKRRLAEKASERFLKRNIPKDLINTQKIKKEKED